MTAGLDWARGDHAVSVVDARGSEISRPTVGHSAAGLRELASVLARAGAGEAAIERPDGPVTGALLDAGVTVVVISPNQVKNLRGRWHCWQDETAYSPARHKALQRILNQDQQRAA